MSAKIEKCCDCGEPTGNAGRGEDSIYIDVAGPGDTTYEVGPLCDECLETKFRPVLYERLFR